MKVAIHQPMYLPWLGLFDRINKCDIFVLLDNVAYSKNYFINRNKIKTANGWVWLTIPVLTKGFFGQLIKDTQIDNIVRWKKQHWKSIYYSYKDAPFSEYLDFFEQLYNQDWILLFDLQEKVFNFLLKYLGIKTKIVKASSLKVTGEKEELVLNICKSLNADNYLSGPDGKNYLDLNVWNNNNINVEFHNYNHPIYPQLYGDFVSNMSVIDLLFNCGEKSLEILSKNGEEL